VFFLTRIVRGVNIFTSLNGTSRSWLARLGIVSGRNHYRNMLTGAGQANHHLRGASHISGESFFGLLTKVLIGHAGSSSTSGARRHSSPRCGATVRWYCDRVLSVFAPAVFTGDEPRIRFA
jgi:hypothetical protein